MRERLKENAPFCSLSFPSTSMSLGKGHCLRCTRQLYLTIKYHTEQDQFPSLFQSFHSEVMIPNSTKLQRSRPTASTRLPKEPDTNLSDAKHKIPNDRPRAGRSMSDRSIELGRRSIPLISQRQRSASSRLGAAPAASLETTTSSTKSRSDSARPSHPPDIFDRWNTWSRREESSHATVTASTSATSSSSSPSPSSSPASKKKVFADQFQVHQCLAARGKEIRAIRSRRSRPVTNDAKQHSEVRASKEPVKTNSSKVTFSSSAKKIDGGSRVRRCRSSNSGLSSIPKGDRRRHARHRKCEIEGLSLMQSLSIYDKDHPTGIDNTTASDSMRTLVSMSSYESPMCPSSLDPPPPPPPPPLNKTCAQMAAHSECGPTSTGSSGSLEVIWSPPCA